MLDGHNPKARFGLSLRQARQPAVQAAITNTPPLPAVNFAAVGRTAPTLSTTASGSLPKADAVVITWAEAEWAAMQQVFCGGGSAMPYSDRTRGSWSGWQQYSAHLPTGAPSSWDYWGYYRLVNIGSKPVLLFKSNTHLDYPGASYLQAMIKLLVSAVGPDLILSIGTAGGAKPQDHIGTVRAVSAGTLFESGQPQASWPEYGNSWTGGNTLLDNTNFQRLLLPMPTRSDDLQTLCTQLNQQHRSSYSLAQLDPEGLNLGDPTPQIDNQTGGSASLLTTATFVVGTNSGVYQTFSAIEMDDAVIGDACKQGGTAFGFVRNISDPVQNAALPAEVQGNWGSTVYDAYGFYSSYNGAVTAWALLASL